MSWTIDAAAVPDLARGAAVLGTGGGGDPYIGALLARQAVAEHGPVTVVRTDEVPDDALGIVVAMMGAPTVMVEKLPGLAEVTAAVTAVGRYLGRPVTHVLCAEVGGVNSTIPVAAAAALGLPLVDGDGMGRAFPELQMVIPTLYGVTAAPMAFADEKGNTGVVETVTNTWAERILRVALVEMGCEIMIAGFAMTGVQVREALVLGTLSRATAIGRGIREARAAKLDPVAATVAALGGRELFAGKVSDVERGTTTGFARGRATVVTDGGTGVLSFQNEHLLATLDDQVLVTAPDLVIVLEQDSGEPITTESLRYGQRVRVLSAPADERWHSPEGLAMVGPAYFGYDVPPRRFDGTVEDPSGEAVAHAVGPVGA